MSLQAVVVHFDRTAVLDMLAKSQANNVVQQHQMQILLGMSFARCSHPGRGNRVLLPVRAVISGPTLSF